MTSGEITIAAVGDILCHRKDPLTLFARSRSVLRDADIAFGQLETAYSGVGSRGSSGWRGAVPHDVRMYAAIPDAGFDVISLASNHAMDWGADALLDCIERLRRDHIAVVGAGANVAEARVARIIERRATRVAFLSYCSVAPSGYYAASNMPGVAPMRAFTHYEPFEPDQPGTPCTIMTWPDAADLAALVDDVAAAKRGADVVVVSLHWGLHEQRASIAEYQRAVAHAAVDAGADVVLGHHPHVLKGIEVYKDRVIFYSLGNFAFDRLSESWWDTFNIDWMRKRSGVYGIRAPQDRPYHAFTDDARFSMIARVYLARGHVVRVAYMPVVINASAEPVPYSVTRPQGRRVERYVSEITREAGLETEFGRNGGEVVVWARRGRAT